MNKPLWWNKLRSYRRQQRRIASGRIYHNHCNQVIVSKQELRIQLQEAWCNENLLACLAFGPGHPRYAYWLLMASIKFWFIGSLAYPRRSKARRRPEEQAGMLRNIPADGYGVAKPPRRCYERELFDNFLESEEEARLRLEQLSRRYPEEKPAVTAKALLQKYTAVKRACLRMLTSTREFYFAQEYKSILDYIAAHKDAALSFRSEDDDMPTLPDGSRDGGSDGFYGDLYG